MSYDVGDQRRRALPLPVTSPARHVHVAVHHGSDQRSKMTQTRPVWDWNRTAFKTVYGVVVLLGGQCMSAQIPVPLVVYG